MLLSTVNALLVADLVRVPGLCLGRADALVGLNAEARVWLAKACLGVKAVLKGKICFLKILFANPCVRCGHLCARAGPVGVAQLAVGAGEALAAQAGPGLNKERKKTLFPAFF